MDDTRSTYSRGAIALHWTTSILLVLNILGGFLHDSFGEAAVGLIMGLHKATGILILVLAVAWLMWRLTHRAPPLPATVKRWEKGLAHTVQWTFYILMLALPVTGWLMVSSGSRKGPISFYGLFDVPFLPVAQDKLAAGAYTDRHEILAIITAVLIAIHVAAALKHHLIDRDNTLVRMLPWLRRRAA